MQNLWKGLFWTLVCIIAFGAIFFLVSMKYAQEELRRQRVPSEEMQITFKDFSVDEYDLEDNMALFDTRAYLKINLPGKASDNLEELNKILDRFEADNNAVINHWHEDEDDPNYKNEQGYFHGIWISYQERPVDYE